MSSAADGGWVTFPATPLRCAIARDAGEVDTHHRVRHAVFVEEQAVFAGTDRDDHDCAGDTIKVLGFCGAVAAGAVRLFPLAQGAADWQGDRLAVLSWFRSHRLGAPLVEFAVATAAGMGGRHMAAHVQLANVEFFEQLGWRRTGPVADYVGLAHQPMGIDLSQRSSGPAATALEATVSPATVSPATVTPATVSR